MAFPEVFSMFTTGAVTQNVGFFVELETNLEEEAIGVERGFVTFNNLGKHDLAHLRVGKIDPSAYFSYPTLRQQLELIGDSAVANGAFLSSTINRISLTPLAFAAMTCHSMLPFAFAATPFATLAIRNQEQPA